MHGQFYDLLNMERALHIGKQQTLFLGDYVDRGMFTSVFHFTCKGDFSTEIVFLLLALKIHFPKNIWMLRGNHESRMMGGYMSFALECNWSNFCRSIFAGDKKYGSEELYVAFSELFDSLPLAALIRGCATGTFFAVHGGISPTLQLATDINKLNRFREPPSDGLMWLVCILVFFNILAICCGQTPWFLQLILLQVKWLYFLFWYQSTHYIAILIERFRCK